MLNRIPGLISRALSRQGSILKPSGLLTVGRRVSGDPADPVAIQYLKNTGVTAGAYTNANITVDKKGRVSAAANGSAASSRQTQTTNTGDYTPVLADLGNSNLFNHATTAKTWALLAAATAANGFSTFFENINAALLTLDGSGSETIDGSLTLLLSQGMKADLITDGTSWKTQAFLPAFVATRAATQTLTQNTWQRISINTKVFDTHTVFDASTNFRFQPLRAGYYFAYGGCSANGAASSPCGVGIYKNGVADFNVVAFPGGANSPNSMGFDMIFLNGSTDYLELYGYASNAAPTVTSSFFGAFRVF